MSNEIENGGAIASKITDTRVAQRGVGAFGHAVVAGTNQERAAKT
ncbi:MAG: hypothetical protein WCA19_04310 [Candidatus Acidiferrales bacterium]